MAINKKWIIIICLASLCFAFCDDVDAAWGARPAGPVYLEELPIVSGADHYRRATNFFNHGRWEKAVKEYKLVAVNFPDTSYGQDAYFFLGCSYFQMSELDLANEAFTAYLDCQSNPTYFQECIEYKFYIAESFRAGAKRRFLGSKQLPKWSMGDELAIEVYDEVISAMPSHEIAANSLYGKAFLLWRARDYKCAVETFQTLISRFPKHELAAESYLFINRVYFDQCRKEFQNPDLLAFAEINLRRFEQQFPGEERLEQAANELLMIKEVYAQGMYDTALFYERLNQPLAAVIYYQKAIVDFSETRIAQCCRERLSSFCPQALLEIENPGFDRNDKGDGEVSDSIDFIGLAETKENVSA